MANKTSTKSTRAAEPAHPAGGNPRSAAAEGDGPEVLRFEAQLSRQPEAAKIDLQPRLVVPQRVGKLFPSRGMTKVEGTINGHPFRAVLEPDPSGSPRLRVNRAMLEGSGADAGDTVRLAILGPEPEAAVPADLRAALTATREAKTLWDDLTSLGRRDWVRWIGSAKKPETRTRRVTRTVEQLASGKRRPCCVNVYEYVLRRVREEDQAGGP